MILKIVPTKKLKGRINLPASKSYSIRAYIIAACGGVSQIIRPSKCEDAIMAKQAVKALKSKRTVNVGESGTTLRFILPLAALRQRKVKITGKGTLRTRPNHHLVQTLKGMGVKIKGIGRNHSIPLVLEKSEPRAGKIMIDGTMSSQFISGLLLMTPQLDADSTIILKGKIIVSADYIKMTLHVLKKAGIHVIKKNERTYHVRGNQTYKGLKNFIVPSDYGLAAFHMVAAALTQSHITLSGHLKKDFIQADGHILPILRKMGVRFTQTDRTIKMKRTMKIKGGNFSLKTAPDLLPILAVLALFAQTRTRFTDIGHVRVKESDRITDLRKELEKIGAKVKEKRNELTIYPLENYKTNCLLDPHKDHRLAMAFSVLGLKVGVRVKDIKCCAKSYPEFVRDLKRLGAHIST